MRFEADEGQLFKTALEIESIMGVHVELKRKFHLRRISLPALTLSEASIMIEV